MAPLCMACRLPLLRVLIFSLLLSLFIKNVSSILMHDRLTLLYIRDSTTKPNIYGSSGQSKTLPPYLASVPQDLWPCPCSASTQEPPQKTRKTKRGPCQIEIVCVRDFSVWSSLPRGASPGLRSTILPGGTLDPISCSRCRLRPTQLPAACEHLRTRLREGEPPPGSSCFTATRSHAVANCCIEYTVAHKWNFHFEWLFLRTCWISSCWRKRGLSLVTTARPRSSSPLGVRSSALHERLVEGAESPQSGSNASF